MRNIRDECGDGPHTYPSLAPIGEGGNRLRDSPSPLLDLYQKYAETCGDGERCPDLMDTGTHPEGGQRPDVDWIPKHGAPLGPVTKVARQEDFEVCKVGKLNYYYAGVPERKT